MTIKLGALVDKAYAIKEKRCALQKKIDELDEQFKEAKKKLIDEISKEDSSGVTGKRAKAVIKVAKQPTVKDWDKFHKYIIKNKRMDLLQKRVNSLGIKELWEDGKTVPGVEVFNAISISLTKV